MTYVTSGTYIKIFRVEQMIFGLIIYSILWECCNVVDIYFIFLHNNESY